MEEQTENFEIPSRWRRFFAYLLDLLTNLIIFWFITYFILSFMDRLILYLIIIVLLIIFEVMFIFFKKTTPWNKSVWIIALTNNYPISWWQAMLRYFVFNPAFLALILFLFKFVVWSFAPWWYPLIISGDPSIVQYWRELFKILIPISNCAFIISMILCLLNIVEIFLKCPTFIDKRLWIKRVYKKNPS